ncbi:PhzF family phenazine biosynthesis protein [Roseibium marinum]|uniref:PhzF family phenazine biosynthesis protein n=1 Tax=Roseibium marinum TaxID=281252 RepID=A0A2S3UN68_9HYPH|nr:PhzF family phenazine biosynthesis isomerase [Roseibium marinum]POF29131.1 PhzF family phenazine biosynthesis protein [Roseibium marinum]
MPTAVVVRVFPCSAAGGNPAPIVLDASKMSGEEMRMIAEASGHESGFVVSSNMTGGSDFHFRYFVPNHEMEMCGHATIGALWLLRDAGRIANTEVAIETLSGRIDAIVPPEGPISISQPAGDVAVVSEVNKRLVCEVLGVEPGALCETTLLNARTSRVKTLIALARPEQLHALDPDFSRIENVCDIIGSTGLYPIAMGNEAGVVHARQFPKSSGYPEDAATGIAASALAFGLLHWGRAVPTDLVRVFQGEAMGRASEILVSFERDGEAVRRCWIHGSCTLDDGKIASLGKAN